MIITEIVTSTIDPFPSKDNRSTEGAELIFNGRVRGKQSGRNIRSLFYECYAGMAENELRNIATEAAEKFPIKDLFCRHRIGEIPVGEVALHVSIWSVHRQEGLDAMTWFIAELKRRVPIWKWAILKDGKRIPS